jgi:acyl carrier protein
MTRGSSTVDPNPNPDWMVQMTSNIDDEIRRILGAHGHLASNVDTVSERQDLFHAGMTSHANVNVLIALEDAFDIEFPEEMLQKSTFESIAAIREAVLVLLSDQVSA